MKFIRVNAATMALIEAHAQGNFVATYKSVDGGLCEFQVDDDVHEALLEIDPDMDEAIRILCSPTTSIRRQ